MKCGTCKFYDESASLSGECRRYAPKYARINYPQLAYLQAIALSAIKQNSIDIDASDIDIQKEVTEIYHDNANWPDVSPDDWCGEYHEKE